jgi:hypothetical protein
MVEGPHGAGRIETVSVINGGLPPVSSTATTTLSSTTSPPTTGIAQIASSHPDGETLPSTGPVTQGEILRQEQEAGIVLSNPHSVVPNRSVLADIEGASTILDTVEPEEEVPHARGPEIIGPEDTGSVKLGTGLNIEGAVGRPSLESARASKSPGPATDEKADEVMVEADDVKSEEKEAEVKRAEENKAEKHEDKDEEMKSDS